MRTTTATSGALITACVLAALLSACDPEPHTPDEAAPAEPPPVELWGDPPPGAVHRLADREATVFGATDDLRFHQVQGVVVLPSRALVVADGGSQSLIAMGLQGDLLWTQGGRGMGPGEFRRLTALTAHPSGGVAALDPDQSRVTLFSESGEVLRTIPLPAEGRGRFRAPAWLEDGTFVIGIDAAVPSSPRDQVHRPPLTLLRLDETGDVLDTIAEPAGRETFVTTDMGLQALVPAPFAKDVGYGITGGSLVLGPSDSTTVEVLGMDGSLEHRIAARLGPVPVSDDTWASYQRRQRERFGDNELLRERWDSIQSRMVAPSHRLPVGPIRVDQAGDIWIPESRDQGLEPERWWVLEMDGSVREVWSMGSGATFLTATRDLVVTLARDTLDVETVEVRPRDRAQATASSGLGTGGGLPRGTGRASGVGHLLGGAEGAVAGAGDPFGCRVTSRSAVVRWRRGPPPCR